MELSEFFGKNTKVAAAFSGGCDSSYLVYAAKSCGADVHAYLVRTQFQPEFEVSDAVTLAGRLQIPITVIERDILSCGNIAENPVDRCYRCKSEIFAEIKAQAAKDGYTVLIEGTTASDNASDRPGTAAVAEQGFLSPLKMCGLEKDEIRRLSREAELLTWDKPAYACLATRIPAYEEITAEKLNAIERSEKFLAELGFTDYRVRVQDGAAKIQLREEQFPLIICERKRILNELRKYFSVVTLDMEVRR